MENKMITKVASIILIAVNVGLFAFVWIEYYNNQCFNTYRDYGLVVMILLYFGAYRYLSKLYRGYDIASSSIGETLLSQFISVSLANLLLYVTCCIIANHYVSFVPGLIIMCIQLFMDTVLVTVTKKILIAIIEPLDTLVIYGERTSMEDAVEIVSKLLKKYSHMFKIKKIIRENDGAIKNKIKKSQRIIFIGVSANLRSNLIDFCINENIPFYFVPEIEDLLVRNCEIKNFIDTPIMRYDFDRDRKRSRVVKRCFDIIMSLFMIVITSPVMLVTAILIKLEDGGPILYKQERLTLNGKKFKVIKFRSMIVDAEKDGIMLALNKDKRITKVGNVIRKNRIDELPQLFNVLIGQMSMVGPRPEREEYATKFEKKLPEFKYRYRVKGGLTGYAQVYGKYNTSPEDKLKLDLIYMENQNLILDIRIILLTIKTIFIPESTQGFEEKKSELISKANIKIG